MQKSKLIGFLSLLSKAEISEFKLYLASPIFRARESLVVLLDALLEAYIEGEGNASKEEIYFQVFGEGEFKEATLKVSMSTLLSMLRDFLSFQEYRSDKSAQNVYLLKKLHSVHDQNFFPKFHESAIKSLQEEELTAADYFHELSVLNELECEFIIQGPQRDPQDYLKEAVRNRAFSFLVRMMRYNNANINRKHTFSNVYEPKWMALVIQYIGAYLEEMPSIVQAYYYVYSALEIEQTSVAFEKAKTFLHENQAQYSRKEAMELFLSLLNHSARELNKGKTEHLERIFQIYVELMEAKLIVNKNKISPWHLKNIINVSSRLKKFEWAEDFLTEWQSKVTADHKENAKNFNCGMLHFYKEAYDEAEVCFNRLLDDYKDVFYGIDSRGYLLQIYFETGNSVGLDSLCHSFRMFLDRNTDVAEGKRREYITFINHLRRFIGIPLDDVSKLQALKSNLLEKENRGMGSDWLISKINLALSAGS